MVCLFAARFVALIAGFSAKVANCATNAKPALQLNVIGVRFYCLTRGDRARFPAASSRAAQLIAAAFARWTKAGDDITRETGHVPDREIEQALWL
jgi:hypothetical protein